MHIENHCKKKLVAVDKPVVRIAIVSGGKCNVKAMA